MNCPNCNETLVMSDRNGVEIDYCPKCRGVWLDKGELDKIIEKSQGEMRQQNQDRFDDDDDNDFGRRNPGQRRKGGFLGNLFDFD